MLEQCSEHNILNILLKTILESVFDYNCTYNIHNMYILPQIRKKKQYVIVNYFSLK